MGFIANAVKKARFMAMKDGFARADYLRKKNVLQEIGENVYYYSRVFPSDPKLLKLHSNVVIATNVRFVFHDRVDIMLTGLYHQKYTKWYDCIEVMDNVFIGADCVILPGVRIGENTIIGAGAVVTKDIPPGYIWGGVPARKIGVFSEFIEARRDMLSPERDPKVLWEQFSAKRD